MGTRNSDDESAWRARAERAERELESLRTAAAELAVREQRERHRLSRELHGNLQQLIVLAKMRLGRLALTTNEELKAATAAVDEVLAKAVAESRAFCNLLSPPLIHDAGLLPALRWLIRTEAESGGLAVDAELADDLELDDVDRRVALFGQLRSLLEEARAAGAKRATLTGAPVSATEVRLSLRFTPAFPPSAAWVSITGLGGTDVEVDISDRETRVVLVASND